jgi:hypothetical protein
MNDFRRDPDGDDRAGRIEALCARRPWAGLDGRRRMSRTIEALGARRAVGGARRPKAQEPDDRGALALDGRGGPLTADGAMIEADMHRAFAGHRRAEYSRLTALRDGHERMRSTIEAEGARRLWAGR